MTRSAGCLGRRGLLLRLRWLSSSRDRAQTYSRGQNASPAFEGWEKNGDGSFNFLFGYMNRNWEEELNVPIGPDNNIEPGGPDQGQPTRLLPRAATASSFASACRKTGARRNWSGR